MSGQSGGTPWREYDDEGLQRPSAWRRTADRDLGHHKLVRDSVQQFAVTTSIALVNTLHTTCAVRQRVPERADDLRSLIEKIVPERDGYRHDDPRVSDCERGNAHSHLRAALVGRNIAVGVNNGELTLGRFQSVIFAELDGPRKREISIQVIGE